MKVSAEKETTLRELLKDDMVVISWADKGSGIVVGYKTRLCKKIGKGSRG